jgi:hypothetical protein
MKNDLNSTIDQLLVSAVEWLVGTSPNGEYRHEDAISRTVQQLRMADVNDLKRGAVAARFARYQKRESERARADQQQTLPGDFSPPEGEFHFDGVGIPKARALNDHWLRWLQQKVDHITEAQAAFQAQMAEYRSYVPYLSSGMTTAEAYEAYRRDNPHIGSEQAAD